MNHRKELIKKLLSISLSSSSAAFSHIISSAECNERSLKYENQKVIKNTVLDNENKSNFQRSFLTVDGKKIEIGSKGSGENSIVILHAYGYIPEFDIEITKGETEFPEKYIKLAKKSKSFNNDYIEDFEKLADELSKKYKIIVINRFGYGNSDDTEKERTGDKIADEIHSVIDQLNLKKPVLLAHSMGGLFALSYIKRYPNDVGGYVGLDACTPIMFLEEEIYSNKFEKYDPKTTKWGSVAVVNECNEQLDNAKTLKDFKFSEKLDVLLILSTFASRYMEGQLSKGAYQSSLRDMNEKLVSNAEKQKIIEMEGPHFLYHKNVKYLLEKIENITNEIFENKRLKSEAEVLYNKLKDIMEEFYKNPMSQMEDECRKIMSSKSVTPRFLNERDFEEKSKDNLILYRGMENSSISNDFFNGKVYLSTNTNNMRGTGIYTTTSKECAEHYSGKSTSTLSKMFISKKNSKILENDRLQQIKSVMKKNHPDEFSRFDGKDRGEFINDSAKSYLDGLFNKEVKLWAEKRNIEGSAEEIVAKLDETSMKEISEKIKNDPEAKKVLSTREKFFEDPESFCWYNDGLLTFLLGYDVLHTNEYLRDFHNSKEDEYLIVNPKVLNILKIN